MYLQVRSRRTGWSVSLAILVLHSNKCTKTSVYTPVNSDMQSLTITSSNCQWKIFIIFHPFAEKSPMDGFARNFA